MSKSIQNAFEPEAPRPLPKDCGIIPFVRSPYNYDTMAASDESGLFCPEPTLAQQNAKDECDINEILKRVARGAPLDGPDRPPQFGDFTTTPNDYHQALNIIAEANGAFMDLDANIRARFENDPAQYLAFMQDEKNIPEAIKLGLATARESSEDLSTAPPDAIKGGKAGGAVEKSDKPRKGLFRASTPIPKGYKLVPDGEGDLGDD